MPFVFLEAGKYRDIKYFCYFYPEKFPGGPARSAPPGKLLTCFMKKIAFIIIRYGAEVNGGAEVHCRMLAERLRPYYDVEVLTTTTKVFRDPDNDYPEGVDTVNGVTVRRFKPAPIDGEHHGAYRKKCKTARRIRLRLANMGLLGLISSLHPAWTMSLESEKRYYESQEDHTPQMLEFIEQHKDEYAAFIFMNFYFSQPVLGCTIAPEKTILIPLVHPDKPLYYSINAPMFTRVRHIAFNTAAERRLCSRAFGTSLAPNSLVGCGIEEAPEAEWSTVKAKYGLPDQYVLYLGRITPSKTTKVIPDFLRYKKEHGGDVKLVMVGGTELDIKRSDSPDIIFTGYVSDEEKSSIIRHATVMVNPSRMESLSLLMLEAMQNRVPLLVNGRSRVMKDHCKSSGAAFWYNNSRDFRHKLHRLLSDPELRRTMSEKGPAYVREHYDWDVIIPKLRALIESL